MTADDRPTVTNNARAEQAAQVYAFEKDRGASDLHAMRRALTAAGRAETTTCVHGCTMTEGHSGTCCICGAGSATCRRGCPSRAETTTDLRGYCPDPLCEHDDCADSTETTTATDEDAARAAEVIDRAIFEYGENLPADAIEDAAKALQMRGLLATARTRPTPVDTFEAIADRLGEHPKAYNAFDPSDEATTMIRLDVPVEDLAEFIAPAVLALWADQPTEAEAGARALEQAAEVAEHKTHLWLLDLAADLRGGER